MKIRTTDKTSKRVPRIIYDDPTYPIKSDVIERDDPTKAKGVDYTGTGGQIAAGSGSNCTGGAKKNPTYRLCYLKKFIKSSGIKYYYYTGHKYTPKQVISKKKGNCCDLSRMCMSILKSSSLPTKTAGYPISSVRYCIGNRLYNGSTVRHAWLEVLTNTSQSGTSTVTCTGKDSCGRSKYNPSVTKTYKNVCPACKRTGKLRCGVSYKSVPEGQITCDKTIGGCDADYCIKDGWEKDGHFSHRLTGATQEVSSWTAFDPTSYVTSTSAKVLGTSNGTVTRKSSSTNPC